MVNIRAIIRSWPKLPPCLVTIFDPQGGTYQVDPQTPRDWVLVAAWVDEIEGFDAELKMLAESRN